jgi:glutathione S-transferase
MFQELAGVTIVSLLSLLVYLWTGLKVGYARGKYKIEAPAVEGNPDFERVFRVQQNTLEQIVLFLPTLWLFQLVVGGQWGAIIGIVWPVGRVLYALGYYKAAAKRGLGFGLTILPSIILLLWALGTAIAFYIRGL